MIVSTGRTSAANDHRTPPFTDQLHRSRRPVLAAHALAARPARKRPISAPPLSFEVSNSSAARPHAPLAMRPGEVARLRFFGPVVVGVVLMPAMADKETSQIMTTRIRNTLDANEPRVDAVDVMMSERRSRVGSLM